MQIVIMAIGDIPKDAGVIANISKRIEEALATSDDGKKFAENVSVLISYV
jgi:hypothetical protein